MTAIPVTYLFGAPMRVVPLGVRYIEVNGVSVPIYTACKLEPVDEAPLP